MVFMISIGVSFVAVPHASALTGGMLSWFTLDTRVNNTAVDSAKSDPPRFRVTVDMSAADRYLQFPYGKAEVIVSGPGGFYRYWKSAPLGSWEPIGFDRALPGKYLVTANFTLSGWWHRDSILGPKYVDTQRLVQSFVLEETPWTSGMPTISGSVTVGSTLTANPGSWVKGTTLSYQWYSNGNAITAAQGKTLKLTPALAGRRLTVKVTGSQVGYVTVTKASAAKTVAKATLAAGKPKITGTAKVKGKLTANPGKWTSGTKIAYQWYAGGKAIKGATAKTLKPTKAMKGAKIKVKVTGSKAGYTTVAKTSAATNPVK